MADVLGRIVARKREEVARRLGSRAVAAGPTGHSLKAALGRGQARFIMEVKRASPSGHRAAVTVEEAIAAYAPVADAISVLTDEADFGGSLGDLQTARQLFDGPILAKDFFIDPAQVGEARAAGADAILAMMSVLDDVSAARVLGEARRLNMDAIVEVHDEAELGRALALGADIIGINNRDLKTLTIDLGVTERLAPLVPRDRLVIAESGVRCRADVERLARRVDAFLVGSALMASREIREDARALVHGRVKLCGLTRGGDVELAGRSGASHAGFIFVAGTSRAIAPDEAVELVALARRLGMKSVGVFRDSPPRDVGAVAGRLGLDVVQLHGGEDVAAIRQALPDVELWAACGVAKQLAPRPGADRILFDTVLDGRCGGTGIAFDWAQLARRKELPSAFLAGGIGPANAGAAARVGAHGLDVGSRVEAGPGVKDAAKVAKLFAALRPQSRRAA